jgi:hypothetical protein
MIRRAIVPAQMNRGVSWSLEHRCRHHAGEGGWCWQHRPGGAAVGAMVTLGLQNIQWILWLVVAVVLLAVWAWRRRRG